MVVVEHDQSGIKPVTYELLNAARKLAGTGKIIALYFTDAEEADVLSLTHYGADEVRICIHPSYHQYIHETYEAGLLSEIEKTQPDIVLMPASNSGKELSAAIATRLRVALATDCIDLQLSEEGEVTIKRPVFAGKAYSLCKLRGSRPYLITLRPNIFRGEGADETRTGETVKENISLPDFLNPGLVREVGAELDITEARIIVSGGLGMQGPENFKLLEDLANVLGAAVAASRPVVDNGWQEYSHQVGQTGRTVSPDLYIACGISGAVQHLAGMSSSRCIVAINSDPNAAIFSIADYGIVGNALEIVPLLTQEFKRIIEG
ncbi:electron transfer flavoprotein subunit alpha/FixB family protein [Nitrospina gracilis]|nr:electron transfer flavoprotein subunit alpha/FixB family protein [Nitrospina gracilis]